MGLMSSFEQLLNMNRNSASRMSTGGDTRSFQQYDRSNPVAQRQALAARNTMAPVFRDVDRGAMRDVLQGNAPMPSDAEQRDMVSSAMGSIPMAGFTMRDGRYVPDYLVKMLQSPREVPASLGRQTKDLTAEMLRRELPEGGIARMTNIDELSGLLSGENRVGQNFEGQPGISAQRFNKVKPLIKYGRDSGVSASLVYPESAVVNKGAGANEVKIHPDFSRPDAKYGIANNGFFSWDDLKELYKAKLD